MHHPGKIIHTFFKLSNIFPTFTNKNDQVKMKKENKTKIIINRIENQLSMKNNQHI